jgi:hypothetical protein
VFIAAIEAFFGKAGTKRIDIALNIQREGTSNSADERMP